jgi:tetratricopeptide (TPR) repeat protein
MKKKIKSVFIWWIIILMIEALIVFGLNMIFGLTAQSESGIDILKLAPVMAVSSLAAAVIACVASFSVKAKDVNRTAKRLNAEFRSNGWTEEYAKILTRASEGKDHCFYLLEAVEVYFITGRLKTAQIIFNGISEEAVIKRAESGNIYEAAYYYSVKMNLCLEAEDLKGAAEAGAQGVKYFDKMPESHFSYSFLSGYEYALGNNEKSLELMEKIDYSKIPALYRQANLSMFCLAKAYRLKALERFEEASHYAKRSLEIAVTVHYKEKALKIMHEIAEANISKKITDTKNAELNSFIVNSD